MRMRVLYFSWVRDAVGCDEEQIDFPPDVKSISDVIDYISKKSDQYRIAFADRGRIRCALDQQVTPLDAPLGDATELAFFPPVTGG
jgi:molybdopterin synthase sulfur carrier subunit